MIRMVIVYLSISSPGQIITWPSYRHYYILNTGHEYISVYLIETIQNEREKQPFDVLHYSMRRAVY